MYRAPRALCLHFALPMFAALLGVPLAGRLPAQQQGLEKPVKVRANGVSDACGRLGKVVNLDPEGDNYLSVQSGPGGKPYTERDRLHTGARVHVCGQRGNWYSIVYGATGETDCEAGRPEPTTYTYTGPCQYGWVSKRYVEIIAG